MCGSTKAKKWGKWGQTEKGSANTKTSTTTERVCGLTGRKAHSFPHALIGLKPLQAVAIKKKTHTQRGATHTPFCCETSIAASFTGLEEHLFLLGSKRWTSRGLNISVVVNKLLRLADCLNI